MHASFNNTTEDSSSDVHRAMDAVSLQLATIQQQTVLHCPKATLLNSN